MAVSTIKKMTEMETVHREGTTNSGGNFYVGTDDGRKIVSAIATGTANRLFIPFKQGTTLYLKVLDWNSNDYTPVINGSVAVEITFIR